MKTRMLVTRLGEFMDCWISNPSAQLEFVKLIEAVHQQPRADHADEELLTWIDDQRSGLRYIGIK